MLQLLIPAAGESRRFAEAGYQKPKGLLKMGWRGKRRTMIEHVVESVSDSLAPLIGCRPQDWEAFAAALPADYVVIPVGASMGQADTVARLACAPHIGAYDQLLVVNSDNAFAVKEHRLTTFAHNWYANSKASAGAVVFDANEYRFGYIDAYPDFNFGIEKKPISRYALAGAFFFRSARILLDAWAEWRRDSKPDDEPYLSGLFKYIEGPKLASMIDRNQLHEWGTPQAIAEDKTVTFIEPPTKLEIR